MNLGHVITKSLKGTDFEGMSFGQLLGNILGLATKKILDTEMTGGQQQRAQTELENQQLLNEEEYDRKIDFYERFESPEAQVRQYKSAGLNPALMFGNGASVSASGGIGSAGSVSQASAAGSQSPFSGAMSSILGLMQFGVQARSASANIRSIKAQTEAQKIDNEYKRQLNELEIERRRKDIDKIGSEIDINRQSLEKMVHDTEVARVMAVFYPDLLQSQIDERQASAFQKRASGNLSESQIGQVESIIAKNQAETEKINAEVDQVRQQILVLASEVDLNSARAAEARQSIKESIKRCTLIGKQIGLAAKDIQYYIWNHAKQAGIGPVKFPVVNPGVSSAPLPVNDDGDIDLFELGPD